MTPRPVRVLYVEDDPIQQRLMAHALRGVKEFACDVTCDPTEEGAVAAFRRGGVDLVLVDFHLAQGNGLGVIRRIRETDPAVPIIAVSAADEDGVTTDLMTSGADDYLDKSNLDTRALGRSLRIALLRAEGMKKRLSGPAATRTPQDEVSDLARWVAGAGAARLVELLRRCEAAARAEGVSSLGLLRLFQSAVREQVSGSGAELDAVGTALRPFLLELGSRLFGVGYWPEAPLQ